MGIDTDAVRIALGAELRERRVWRDLTQTQAAARYEQRTGQPISPRSLIAYEHGLRVITVPRLLLLAHTYDVSAPAMLAAALRRTGQA